MALGTCNVGIKELSEYKDLQQKAKTLLRGLYNDDVFDAIMQKYYDENQSLPNSRWIQMHLKDFKVPVSTSEEEGNEKNLSLGSEVSEGKKETPRERWSNKSEGGFEIGSKAKSDLGKKFDPLKAILPEGVVLSKQVGRRYEKIDVGGYSIAAAFALLKGYDQHGLKTPKSTKEINGYGEKVLSTGYVYATKRQKEHLYKEYKELWSRWAWANPEIVKQLKEAVGDSLILDSSATGILYNINPAKAMAEILFGTEEETPTGRRAEQYRKQRENAKKASEEILQAVQRSEERVIIAKQSTSDSFDEEAKKFLDKVKNNSNVALAFDYKWGWRLSKDDLLFVNPFEGEKDALAKFIQWIIPDDFASLPKELRNRKYEIQRNKLRIALNRGKFRGITFITDDVSKKGIRYVDVLKYIADNFEALKSRYNPISDRADEYATAKHKVSISSPSEGKAIAVLSEDANTNRQNNRYAEIVRRTNGAGDYLDEYDITIHDSDSSKMTDSQKERLLKSSIIAIPNGARYSINGSELVTRREKAPKMVITESKFFSREQVAKDTKRVYVFGDNFVDAANGYVPAKTQAVIRGLPNTIGIPTKRNRYKYTDSYLTDSDYDFSLFKNAVDEAVQKMESIIDRNNALYEKAQIEDDPKKKQALLDQIVTIVIPSAGIGTGAAMLDIRAPRLFRYLQEQLEKVEEKGNSAFYEELSLGIQEPNVRALDEAPVTTEQAMSRSILDSPYIIVQQEFGRNLNDAIETVAEYFIDMINDMRYDAIYALDDEMSKVEGGLSARQEHEYKTKRKTLMDPLKGAQMALSNFGNSRNALLTFLKDKLQETADDESYSPEIRALYRKACDLELLNVLLQYALPIIEEKSSIRLLINNNTLSLQESTNQLEDSSNDDDPEGKKSTGNDGWSFNIRENDPYKSLSAGVRRIISTLKMYDPEELNKAKNDDENGIAYLYNAMGSVKYWNSSYIYTAVMSWMAKNLRNNPDNFVKVITDYDSLPNAIKDRLYKDGITKETFSTRLPQGYPTFPALMKMREKYIWANELIDRLTDDYRVPENPTEEDLANVGNIVSQFYTNFNQQFIPYYIMVDGKLIAENHPSGAQSLKEATLNNYEGRITLNYEDGEAAPMVFNLDGSVNRTNLQYSIDELNTIKEKYSPLFSGGKLSGGVDFNDLMDDIDNGGVSLTTAWQKLDGDRKKGCVDLSDTLKTFGINLRPYDIFCIAASHERDVSFSMLVIRANVVANSLLTLAPEDHMIQSGKGMTADGHGSVEEAWDNFFSAFGEYVSEKEYQSSFRDGAKTRYSYSAPSFMSSMIQNLTNDDIDTRRAFIDEYFKPYSWFYDPETDTFKNEWLAILYAGPTNVLQRGHDLINIKENGIDYDYSNWTPDQIVKLMFKEFHAFGKADINSAYYIIPVLSDSQVCKTIQGPRYINNNDIYTKLGEVVKQELERIELCKNRRYLIGLQNKKKLGEPLSKKEEEYLSEHKNIYEIANFDTYKEDELSKGEQFNFIPELNNWTRYASARTQNGAISYVNVLSTLLGMDVKSRTLFDVFHAIDRMDTETFNQRMSDINSGKITTKEAVKSKIIYVLLKNVFREKIRDWAFDYNGNVHEGLVSQIIESNDDLRKEREALPYLSPDETPTAEEKAKHEAFMNHVMNEIENFHLNHSYAMTQFIQLMTTDIAFYKDGDDFSKRWKEVYGAGMKMNTNSKYGKKTERYIILKDNKRRSFSFDVFKEALENAVKDKRITKIEKEVILNKFKRINGTDAQALRGLTSYRTVLDMVGKWTPDMEKAYQNLKANKWDMSDFYTIFQTLKPFTFSSEATDSGFGDLIKTPSQQKNSEAVLLAIYATIVGSSPNGSMYSARAKGINMAMEEIDLLDRNGQPVLNAAGERVKAIDLAQYESSTKVGAQGVIDINYSPKKLAKAKQDSGVTISTQKHVTVSLNDTYYTIVKKLDDLYDSGKITQAEYNEFIDFFEPTAEEVRDIIRDAITSVDTEGQQSWEGPYNPQVLHSTPYSDYCIQQPTPEHLIDNDEGVFGSQIRHIILSDLPDDFEIIINGKKYNRNTLRDHYNKLIIANLMECFRNKIETLFDSSDGRPAIYKLRERILGIVEGNPKYGRDIKQALDIVKDPETGKPVFALPLNNINVTVKLQEIMTSIFKNSITKQTIRGGNAIIAADIGYADSLKVIGERDKDGNLIPGGKIKGIECYLPASAKDFYVPFMVDSKGNSYLDNQKNEPKDVDRDNEGNIIYTLDPKKLKEAGLEKGIGYRIPTEGHYSLMPLIIKGFLPQQSGSSIVIAAEVTQLSGSDNDVDKEYLMLPSFFFSEYRMADARRDFDKSKGIVKGIRFYENITENNLTAQEIEDLEKDAFKVWFEKNKENYRRDKPIIKKIEYDASKGERGNSKAARDNEIIDIMYGILTHPTMSDKWIHPGNFDGLKINERRLRILKNKRLFNTYQKAYKLKSPQETLGHIRKQSLKELDKFLEDYAPQYSPVYPDTFIHYHGQNMAGVAEKGIFANNTTSQVKLQWADINLTDAHTFNVEGRHIKKVDGRYIQTKDGVQRISSNCAECSAASVDNAKDPVLAGLNSNVKTASLYGYMLRLGLTIEEVSLIFAQPHVDWFIRTNGDIKSSYFFNRGKTGVGDIIASILEDAGVDLNSAELDWHEHNFTTDEWYQNIINRVNIYKKENKTTFDFTEAGDIKSPQNIERLKSLYRTYCMLSDVCEAQRDYAKVQRVLTSDSPTHAIATSFAGAVLQTKDVERLNERKEIPLDEKIFTGVENLIVYKIDGSSKEESSRRLNDLSELKVINNEDALFEKLANSALPITQAFYTLGIEKAREVFKNDMIFGRKEIQEFTDRLMEVMDQNYIYDKEQREYILDTAYKDFIVFMLSKTHLFDGDGESTFDEKRQYYLYSFPLKFLEFKASHPWVKDNESLSRMTVIRKKSGNSIIALKRQGQQTTTMRDILMDSFQALLYHDDPDAHELAKDLFMYTYYLNGFEFSYTSYGNLMGTQFLRAFPEYIDALRKMQTSIITEVDMDRFMQQFILKRNGLGLIETINYGDRHSGRKALSHRSETLQHGYFDSGRSLDFYGDPENIPQFIKVDGKEVYVYSPELSDKTGTLCFTPLKQSEDALHYNANQSIAEMLDVVYDNRLIRKNNKLGTQKRSSSSVIRDYIHSTAQEKEIDTVDQNSYSIDDDSRNNRATFISNTREVAEGPAIPGVEVAEEEERDYEAMAIEATRKYADTIDPDYVPGTSETPQDDSIENTIKEGSQEIDEDFC